MNILWVKWGTIRYLSPPRQMGWLSSSLEIDWKSVILSFTDAPMQWLKDRTTNCTLLSLILNRCLCGISWLGSLTRVCELIFSSAVSGTQEYTDATSDIYYLQSQNGNLYSFRDESQSQSEYELLREDVPSEVSWCSEAFGQFSTSVTTSTMLQFM